MKTKLTLSIEEELVKFAKQEAERNGRSVSGMFTDMLVSQKNQSDRQPTKNVAAMVGSLKLYTIDDSKEAIRAAYARKYSN